MWHWRFVFRLFGACDESTHIVLKALEFGDVIAYTVTIIKPSTDDGAGD